MSARAGQCVAVAVFVLACLGILALTQMVADVTGLSSMNEPWTERRTINGQTVGVECWPAGRTPTGKRCYWLVTP